MTDRPTVSPRFPGRFFHHHPPTKDQTGARAIPFVLIGFPSLRCISRCTVQGQRHERRGDKSAAKSLPFWRVAFLFHLRKHTVRLVIDAVRALGHFAVTLDLLLPAHIASLQRERLVRRTSRHFRRHGATAPATGHSTHPRDPPSFRIITIVAQAHGRVIVEGRVGERGGNRRTVVVIGAEQRLLLIHQHGHIEAHAVGPIPDAIHRRPRTHRAQGRGQLGQAFPMAEWSPGEAGIDSSGDAGSGSERRQRRAVGSGRSW